jgi:hypothetical protein
MGRVVPKANEGLAGVTARETRTAAPTLSVAQAVTEPEVAVIVAPPTPVPVANPVLAMVAKAVEDELHVTELVRVCVLPSLYVPVAANCWLVPSAIVALEGVSQSEVSTAGVTVNVAEPPIVPKVAVIVALPCATLVASPPLLNVAIDVAEEVQVAVLVRFCVVPSL